MLLYAKHLSTSRALVFCFNILVWANELIMITEA